MRYERNKSLHLHQNTCMLAHRCLNIPKKYCKLMQVDQTQSWWEPQTYNITCLQYYHFEEGNRPTNRSFSSCSTWSTPKRPLSSENATVGNSPAQQHSGKKSLLVTVRVHSGRLMHDGRVVWCGVVRCSEAWHKLSTRFELHLHVVGNKPRHLGLEYGGRKDTKCARTAVLYTRKI